MKSQSRSTLTHFNSLYSTFFHFIPSKVVKGCQRLCRMLYLCSVIRRQNVQCSIKKLWQLKLQTQREEGKLSQG